MTACWHLAPCFYVLGFRRGILPAMALLILCLELAPVQPWPVPMCSLSVQLCPAIGRADISHSFYLPVDMVTWTGVCLLSALCFQVFAAWGIHLAHGHLWPSSFVDLLAVKYQCETLCYQATYRLQFHINTSPYPNEDAHMIFLFVFIYKKLADNTKQSYFKNINR